MQHGQIKTLMTDQSIFTTLIIFRIKAKNDALKDYILTSLTFRLYNFRPFSTQAGHHRPFRAPNKKPSQSIVEDDLTRRTRQPKVKFFLPPQERNEE